MRARARALPLRRALTFSSLHLPRFSLPRLSLACEPRCGYSPVRGGGINWPYKGAIVAGLQSARPPVSDPPGLIARDNSDLCRTSPSPPPLLVITHRGRNRNRRRITKRSGPIQCRHVLLRASRQRAIDQFASPLIHDSLVQRFAIVPLPPPRSYPPPRFMGICE